jgi:hypothetical protein
MRLAGLAVAAACLLLVACASKTGPVVEPIGPPINKWNYNCVTSSCDVIPVKIQANDGVHCYVPFDYQSVAVYSSGTLVWKLRPLTTVSFRFREADGISVDSQGQPSPPFTGGGYGPSGPDSYQLTAAPGGKGSYPYTVHAQWRLNDSAPWADCAETDPVIINN